MKRMVNLNAEEFGDKRGIAREMLELFEVYKSNID